MNWHDEYSPADVGELADELLTRAQPVAVAAIPRTCPTCLIDVEDDDPCECCGRRIKVAA